MVKSIIAVVGSYLLSIVLVLCSDPILSRIFPGDFVKGHVPTNIPLLVSTAWFVVVSIFCAWICARLAPARAAKHVFWFFVVGEVMGLGATAANWNSGWPHWYGLAWLLSWPVSCWLGLAVAGRGSEESTAAKAG